MPKRRDDFFAGAMGRQMGDALYFGGTCRVCPWEVQDQSFTVVTLAAEEHARHHGVEQLIDHRSFERNGQRGRTIVDVWKEDGY
jgi:hypothetical protein